MAVVDPAVWSQGLGSQVLARTSVKSHLLERPACKPQHSRQVRTHMCEVLGEEVQEPPDAALGCGQLSFGTMKPLPGQSDLLPPLGAETVFAQEEPLPQPPTWALLAWTLSGS